MDEKRYVIEIDFYLYAKTDEEAKEKAAQFCKELQKKDDNQAAVTRILEQPVGKMGHRIIH